MNWADLFERAEDHRTDVETIRDALAARRDAVPANADREKNADREEGPDDA